MRVCCYPSRRMIDVLNMTPEDLHIRDIARSLSLTNRFGGHAEGPINVAQHSVYVSRLTEHYLGHSLACPKAHKRTHLERLRAACQCVTVVQSLEGLLHDASEAYLGDMKKPLKEREEMRAFKDAEDRIQALVNHHFECLPLSGPAHEMSAIVEKADRLMVRVEAFYAIGPSHGMFTNPRYPLPSPEELDLVRRMGNNRTWRMWTWRNSEEAFLRRFYELTGRRD